MSRTDHSRINGTHRAGHKHRAWRKEDYTSLPTRPRLTDAQAIAEALVDLTDAPDYSNVDGLKRLRHLAFWERELLGMFFELDRRTEVEEADEADLTDLAPWEKEALGLPDNAVWQTETGVQVPWDDVPLLYDEAEDEDDWPDSAWLTASPKEFFEAHGDAFVVEGPSAVPEEPQRVGHYVRVHELALEVGIESKHLVTHLRLGGEYVKGHMSWVAIPVADQIKASAESLVKRYGARKDRVRVHFTDDAIAALRERLLGADERAKTPLPPHMVRPLPPRRPMPRPGNPFLMRSL